jgi:hypothetical protein
MKTSRVQQAIKILKSSADDFHIEEKTKSGKAVTAKKSKRVVKKSNW